MRLIKANADDASKKLHTAYLAKLAKELTPAQVESVKDGMTYNTVALTYAAKEKQQWFGK